MSAPTPGQQRGDRPAHNPGGVMCDKCFSVFIGEEWHTTCANCLSGRKLAWVDGVPSVVMAFLERRVDASVTPIHCDLGDSVHHDSRRFIEDAQAWYDCDIVRIRSTKYANIDEVFDHRNYHSGVNGAVCTGEMKFVPRLDYQLPSDMHLWGYTADKLDVARFRRMQKKYPDMRQRAPLIENGITRAECFAILAEAGIRAPFVYSIGYPNGNCIGCVKATSPNYWALTRKHFPDVFARRAAQSHRIGSKLTRIKGKRIFIDEIPLDWPTDGAKVEACDFACTARQPRLPLSPLSPRARHSAELECQ